MRQLERKKGMKRDTIKMAVIDTEKFIEDIYSKQIIWNRNCASNKLLTEAAWTELSTNFGQSIMTLKAKWKGLRDMFRVEIKRIPRSEAGERQMQPHEFESKWVHYRSLLFLAEHMRSRKPLKGTKKLDVYDPYGYVSADYNINGVDVESMQSIKQCASFGGRKNTRHQQKRKNNDSPIPEEHVVANLLLSPESNSSKRRTLNLPQDSLTVGDASDIGDRIMNDDYHFLLSLQPFMAELSSVRKLRLRMKLQKLVFEEVYENPS